MDEKTKAKVTQIIEMVSIYQTSISSDLDKENLKLIQEDLENKKQQLNEVKEELDIELNKLYNNGLNEIDVEVNQLQNEIQEITNSIENISDILAMTTSPKEKLKVQEDFKESNEMTENILEDVANSEKEEMLEIEPEPSIVENSDSSVSEIVENIQYIENIEEPDIEEDGGIQNFDENSIANSMEAEVSQEIVDNFSSLSQEENILDLNLEEEKNEELKKDILADVESEKTQECNDPQNIMIQLKIASKKYEAEAEKVIENRSSNIVSTIEKGIDVSELIMNKIKETLGVENLEVEEQKVQDNVQERNDDEKNLER